MKKINIVKDKRDFDRIIRKRNGIITKYFIINVDTNDENIPKFGITFVKNIGNAVTRNKIKRRIKSIVDNNNIYERNKKYIIIAKKSILNLSYSEIEKELISTFEKINK